VNQSLPRYRYACTQIRKSYHYYNSSRLPSIRNVNISPCHTEGALTGPRGQTCSHQTPMLHRASSTKATCYRQLKGFERSSADDIGPPFERAVLQQHCCTASQDLQPQRQRCAGIATQFFFSTTTFNVQQPQIMHCAVCMSPLPYVLCCTVHKAHMVGRCTVHKVQMDRPIGRARSAHRCGQRQRFSLLLSQL
jgi:hypothetical protein